MVHMICILQYDAYNMVKNPSLYFIDYIICNMCDISYVLYHKTRIICFILYAEGGAYWVQNLYSQTDFLFYVVPCKLLHLKLQFHFCNFLMHFRLFVVLCIQNKNPFQKFWSHYATSLHIGLCFQSKMIVSNVLFCFQSKKVFPI